MTGAQAQRARPEDIERALLQTLLRVPPGRVASYGQIARLAGYPRHARMVGRLLAGSSAHAELPWHRIVNAMGASSLPEGSTARAEQWRRLRAEDVKIHNERVNLRQYQWQDGRGDSPLLDD